LKRAKHITFFSLLLSLACLCCLPTVASAGETVIGVVMTGNTPYYTVMHDAFSKTLNSMLPAGKKVRSIIQKPFPDPIALSNAARKLIAADVDLIVTYGSPATLAVINEDSGIPIIYAGVYDPEAIHAKGPEITGCGYKVHLSSLFRHLRTLKPIATLSVVYSTLEEDSVRQVNELRALTKEQGVGLTQINVKSIRDIKNIDPKVGGDALFVTGSAIVNSWIDEVMAVFKGNRPTVVSIFPDLAEVGFIITLFQSPEEQGEKAAAMVVRVLQGEQPKNIKPELLKNTELVFNLKEARSMGDINPINLIAEATRVIK